MARATEPRGGGPGCGETTRIARVPTNDDEGTEAGDGASPQPAAEGEAPPQPAASARTDATAAAADDAEDPFPPALIVRLRAPDRAASHTIGAATPAQAGPATSLTFGLSPAARTAERAAIDRGARARGRANVLSLPHPRLEPAPTPVATTTSFEVEPEDA